MGTKIKKEPRVHIERGAPDRILPKHFGKILSRRFFPVLSLTYISSVIGVAFKKGAPEFYLFEDATVYIMALLAAAWVSIPAILWFILKGSHLFHHVAGIWYWILAFAMSLTLGISYILIPEIEMYGYEVRTYFTATIPMMFVMYFFCAKQALPASAAYFLTAAGITAMLFGAVIKFM